MAVSLQEIEMLPQGDDATNCLEPALLPNQVVKRCSLLSSTKSHSQLIFFDRRESSRTAATDSSKVRSESSLDNCPPGLYPAIIRD